MKPVALVSTILAALAALDAGAQAVEMKNPPKMTISVTVKEEPVKTAPGKVAHKITGTGEAAYPDGASVQFGIRFKDDRNFVIRGQGFVTAGRWEVELPPMGDNIYHGLYHCQVDFDPELQQPGVLPRIAADKRGRNNASCEQKVGSDEQIAKERETVIAWYKEKAKALAAAHDALKTEYGAQQTAKDRAKWQKVASATQDTLLDLDMAMAAWGRKRLNIMRQDVFDALSGAVLSLKDFGVDAYTAMLAFDGKPPKESAIPQTEEKVKRALDLVEQAAAGGKPPEEPKK